VLSRLLRLLHPFMPHITEELWERFGFTAPNHRAAGIVGQAHRLPVERQAERLPYNATSDENLIMFAEFPHATHLADLAQIPHEALVTARERVAAVHHSVRAARNLRAEYRVASNKKVRFVLKSQPGWAEQELPTFARLINAEEITIDPLFEPKSGTPRVLTAMGELYMPLENLVDANAERERLK